MNYELAPSVLSADFSRLADQVGSVAPFSGRIHVDVMDGHFVPNLTMGPVVVKGLRTATTLPLEVHLMVERPGDFVESFSDAGASSLIFHVEVVDEADAPDLIASIRKEGLEVGIALNPETEWRDTYLELGIDLILAMTVNPGFGGQAFIEAVLPKISQVREAITVRGLDVDIEVDGGIDPKSAARARMAGANIFVAGNAVFGADDPAKAAKEISHVVARED